MAKRFWLWFQLVVMLAGVVVIGGEGLRRGGWHLIRVTIVWFFGLSAVTFVVGFVARKCYPNARIFRE